MKTIIIYVLTSFMVAGALASQSRGVWFWYSDYSPYGSSNIVGTASLESQTVGFLKARGVKRVYGSYKNRSVDEPTVIADWNTRLHNNGISSQILLAEPTWVTNNPSLLNKITSRVVNFNTAPGRLTSEKFKAVHLDLEPQQLGTWDDGSPAVKRDLLNQLLNTYTSVRAHLDTAGLNSVGLYADLPVWYDKLPVDGGSVGWTDATDRASWYAAIGVPLVGVSLMAFQRDSFSNIDGAVAYERTSIPGATVRTAIQADVGVSETWADIGTFKSMMDTLEDNYGFNGAVDIENYRLWREVVAAQPIVSVSALLQPYTLAGDINFDIDTGGTYVILSSLNLCNWKTIHRVRSARSSNMATNMPVDMTEPHKFFKIYRFEDFKEQ